MQKDHPLRIGIVGYGAMGRQHALRLLSNRIEGLVLSAVADPVIDEKDTEALSAQNVLTFQSAEQMHRSQTIDAVILCSPHHLHGIQARDALESGIHVLCEKPIALNMDEVLENIELAQKKDLVYAMAYNQRRDPVQKAIHDIIHSGELGEIRRILHVCMGAFRTQAYYHAAAWRATWAMEGGGMLMNQTSHALDQLLWWMGPPSVVTAHLGFGQYHPTIFVDDNVNVCLQYPNGAICNLIASTGEYPDSSTTDIIGDCGRLKIQNGKVTLEKNDIPCSVFSLECKNGFAHPETTVQEVEIERGNDPHAELLQNFADHLIKGTPLDSDAHCGEEALKLAHAIYLSAWKERSVKFPVDEALFRAEYQERIANEKPHPVEKTELNLQNAWKK